MQAVVDQEPVSRLISIPQIWEIVANDPHYHRLVMEKWEGMQEEEQKEK